MNDRFSTAAVVLAVGLVDLLDRAAITKFTTKILAAAIATFGGIRITDYFLSRQFSSI